MARCWELSPGSQCGLGSSHMWIKFAIVCISAGKYDVEFPFVIPGETPDITFLQKCRLFHIYPKFLG